MPEPVEMRPAYQWTCPLCGTDHYEPCMFMEISDEDREQEPVLEEAMTGDWVTYPDEVECPDCGQTFPTQSHKDDLPEEDNDA